MKTIATPSFCRLVVLAASLSLASRALAAVTVTPASGGESISADTAANAATPAWTSLSPIVIAEPSGSNGDIGGGTLIVRAPAGFEFNTNSVPSVSFEAGRNITAATIELSNPTTLRVTLTVSGSTLTDTLTIGATTPLQVRPTAVTPLASGDIYRPTTSGGTAVIAGITRTASTSGSGGTSFGRLYEVPVGTLFADNFTRSTDPGPLAPWVVQAGNWAANGNVLNGGPNTTNSYGYSYLTNQWNDCSVQAQLQFPVGAYGGGVATRLNPATGARYAAWIYPAGSIGSADWLVLFKFVNWTNWTVLHQDYFYGLGTNWHSLRLVARGNRLAAHYDGNLVMSGTDPDAQPFLSGGAGVELFTDATSYTLLADDVQVTLLNGVLASNDTYTARQSDTLVVPAPGVLSNDLPEVGPLTALLDSNPAHGTLTLSTNGGFTYVPVAGYTGTDTFTYRAQDGSTTSTVATVTITVTLNSRPVAANDSYTLMANTTLTVPAPGILANDSDANGDSLTAVLVASPTKGTLNLSSNGAFTYVPAANYTGSDSFTYRASDGLTNSTVATVSLSVTTFTPLYSDTFTRTSLSPWVVQAGNWAANGSVLNGGPNTADSYGYIYLTNQWSDCSVQARLQFTAGAYGGGLDGRLDPVTGARYAAWVFPEGSPGGSSVLKLLKFQDWSQFTELQQVPLPGVGTNWHTLKLVMHGNRIAVHYDGLQVLNMTDFAVPSLISGGVGVDFWTATDAWTLVADDVAVNAVRNVLATNDSYTVRAGGTLTVPTPGVLANDVADLGPVTAVLATNVAHGELTLSTDGGFTYTPASGYSGSDTFVYQATDGVSTSSPATVTITVTPNSRPVATNDSYTLMVNTSLTVAAPGILANDSDADGDSLTAVLVANPTKGTLNLSSNGAFTYVPAADYTGADSFTYRASDGQTNSTVATVNISVIPFNSFSDTFTRTSLLPWIVQAGNWAANGSVLNGGPNTADSYGYIYLTNQWSDYSVQARLQFTTGAYGGGVDGRLDPVTGARYAAWVFPEGSPGGSSVLKLLKFQDWSQFTELQQVPLPGVGTNWHTLKLVMQGNQVAAHYDGVLMLNVTDSSAPSLLSGGVSFDMWTSSTPWTFTADDLAVNAVGNVWATNDSYSVRMAGTLTVPAPGVLANDAREVGSLTAVLGANVTHGTLSLSSNGGFTYTALGTYTGSDTFTYRCTDGVHTSSLATVAITILANGAPTATNDSYEMRANSTLTVAGPGILANDNDPDGDPLHAVLGTGPSHGTLSLFTNGGFVYTPTAGYVGSDSFTYRCADDHTNSGLATVSISVTAFSSLFSDTFTRTSLSPWVVQAGNWAANGSVLNGGTNSADTYGYAYLANAWTDYEVQARIQLPAGAFGGGLAGRLTPATGARYAVWIYPEGSSGGSNVWKLLKFQDWENFTLLQQGGLSDVGTSWHTLGLAFRDNRIAVYCDGTQLTSVTDSQPHTSGGIDLELWNAAAWVMSADDVQVFGLTADVSISAVGIVPNWGNQTVAVTFQGEPGGLYLVQATTNVGSSASWLNVSTNVAGGDGRWTFTDSLTALPRRFYRAAKP